MSAGDYRHPVTIQQKAETGTASGGTTESWSKFASWRCKIEPLSGTEFFEGAALDREVNVRLIGYYIPGVTAAMRVLNGSTVYNIQSVVSVEERNRELEIMAVQT